VTDRIPPHNLEAERSLIGGCLLSKDAISSSERIVAPGDFYSANHGMIYDAIIHLWRDGSTVDPVVVSEELSRRGLLEQVGGAGDLISMMAGTPAVSSAPRYAKITADLSTYRKILRVAFDMEESAYAASMASPGDLVDWVLGQLGEVDVALDSLPDGVSTFDEFLDRPVEDRPPWCVPGLLRVGWRCMLVAAEGVGKTVLFRQIGLAIAQGIHPLHFQPCIPSRVLIVDLENPEDSIVDVCNPIRATVQNQAQEYDPDRAWLWHKPAGIDLRSRADRSKLEAVIAHTKPDLVCLGPLYKCYTVSASESDEQAAGEVMRVFDDLRTRYSFGLLMEHHAPKGAGRVREMMPYGSSLWLRWPEIGLSMKPDDHTGNVMSVGRWRGDRLENEWPTQLIRSSDGPTAGTWPWRGRWPDGTFLNQNQRVNDVVPPDDDDDYGRGVDEVPF